MDLPSATFDIVFESTMFVQIVEEATRDRIATEMLRVCRPGGWLLLSDWRYGKPRNDQYRALRKSDVLRMFRAGSDTELVCVAAGALVPPVGRLLSARAPSLYFLVSGLMPWLVGQVTYLLRRTF